MVYSHWNQKESKNLIGLCALTLFSFSPVSHFFLSLPFKCMCTHVCDSREKTQTHTHYEICIATHQQTGTSSSHAYSHMHTHFCHNHLYAKWLAVMGCYGCCYQVMWQEAASCFTSHLWQCKGVRVGTYRAEEAITRHESAHNWKRNNRDWKELRRNKRHQRCTVMDT